MASDEKLSASEAGFRKQIVEALNTVLANFQLYEEFVSHDENLPSVPEYCDDNYIDNFRLSFCERAKFPDKEVLTITELREKLRDKLEDYVTENNDNVLLVKVAAGGGKTYGGVQLAQWCAENGLRVLWCANRHNMFFDISNIPNFKPELWYHWLSIREQKSENDPLPTTCRFTEAQKLWSAKGYKTIDLCKQLCGADDYIKKCTYRTQAKAKQPIIFAQHQHLITGLAISDFDLVIIDELPLKVFCTEKIIPLSGLHLPVKGSLERLTLKLIDLCKNAKKKLFGVRLFNEIAPYIKDLLYEIQTLPENIVAQVPFIEMAEDVKTIPYFYIFQFLNLAAKEYNLWNTGASDWLARIKISSKGLHMFSKEKLWDDLPEKVLVLDATAEAGIYQQIFNRPIETYSPRIKRKGNLYQITGLLNGVSALANKNQLDRTIELVKNLIEEYNPESVGIICHLAYRKYFEELVGKERVVHFFASRGTNILEKVKCLVVVGTPSPDINQVTEMLSCLDDTRIENYYVKGRLPFNYEYKEYTLTDECSREYCEGQGAMRQIRGFWNHPELQDIYSQFRESEIVQSLHRSRMNVHDCEVYLLSSIVTPEVVDRITDDPVIGPPGLSWRVWLKLKPWLNEQWQLGNTITVDMIATFLDRSPTYISNNAWLHKIAQFMPTKWVRSIEKVPNKKHARFILVPGME